MSDFSLFFPYVNLSPSTEKGLVIQPISLYVLSAYEMLPYGILAFEK
jgi:hypothetical protein